MKKKKVKHPKMDPYLIANVKHEIDYVVAWAHKNKMPKAKSKDVRIAIKLVGHSRRKVYNELRRIFGLL